MIKATSSELPDDASMLLKKGSRDFFDLFDLPGQFDVDLKLLKSRYLGLQVQCHPDQHGQATDAEKMAAVQMSSMLNDAYAVLSDTVKRATYLLTQMGVDTRKERAVDMEILMEQIGLRERFEDLFSQPLELRKSDAKVILDELIYLFEVACAEFSLVSKCLSDNEENKRAKLRQTLFRLMFLDKLKKEVSELLEEIEDV